MKRTDRRRFVKSLLFIAALTFIAPKPASTQEPSSRRSPLGEVTALLGEVTARRGVAVAVRAGEPVPLAIGSSIMVTDRVRTAAGAKLEIALVSGGTMVIGPDSNVSMERFDAGPLPAPVQGVVDLLSGIVRLVLNELPAGSSVDVRTTAAVAMVRGTEFVVQIDHELPVPTASVFVASGTVQVEGRIGEAVRLQAGEGVDVAEGEAAGPVNQWGAQRVARVLELVTIR